jgi:hypothetical protein
MPEKSVGASGVAPIVAPTAMASPELAAAGVVFDELNMGAIKTVNHIATVPGIGRSAWFKDPDGNTLALFQSE